MNSDEIWTRSGSQGNQWKAALVDISEQSGSWTLALAATLKEDHEYSYVALDDLYSYNITCEDVDVCICCCFFLSLYVNIQHTLRVFLVIFLHQIEFIYTCLPQIGMKDGHQCDFEFSNMCGWRNVGEQDNDDWVWVNGSMGGMDHERSFNWFTKSKISQTYGQEELLLVHNRNQRIGLQSS